jgi:hypothetical protein
MKAYHRRVSFSVFCATLHLDFWSVAMVPSGVIAYRDRELLEPNCFLSTAGFLRRAGGHPRGDHAFATLHLNQSCQCPILVTLTAATRRRRRLVLPSPHAQSPTCSDVALEQWSPTFSSFGQASLVWQPLSPH